MSDETPLTPIAVLRLSVAGLSDEQVVKYARIVADRLLRDLNWSKIHAQKDPRLASSAWKKNPDKDLCLIVIKEFVDRQVQEALRKEESELDRFKSMIDKFNDSYDKQDALWNIYKVFSVPYRNLCEIMVGKDNKKWDTYKAAFNFAFDFIESVTISLHKEAADLPSQT